MPTICTPAPDIKGAADNESSPLSSLQTQLSKHQTFHGRVKAINAALRKARIDPAAADAEARCREVLTEVLIEERLVEMYLRQLWQVGRGGRYVAFPASVLVKNGQTIRALRDGLERGENETSRQRDSSTPTAQGHNLNLEGNQL
jgi:hypothetical protein